MPGFPDLSPAERGAITSYLLNPVDPANLDGASAGFGGLTYTFAGYEKFLDPDGYPANAPPWGSLSAIDINTGRFIWRIPFGDYPELAAIGLHTGTENYGGAVVTAGGLLIIAATIHDHKLHVYDKLTGQLLWETELPTASVATPATYMSGGRQFIVVAAGGGKSARSPAGGKILAYALP